MNARVVFSLGSIAMALAVALGAFGAHALKTRLPADALSIWQTAVQYHAWHALGLLAIGAWTQQSASDRLLRVAVAPLLVAGIVLFSGSLYGLALTGVRALGAVTPVGGAAWIVAWVLLAVAALKGRSG